MTNHLKSIYTITKKEFKAYFNHPMAYIVLVVFLVINSFFYFRSAFVYNVADVRTMFDMFLWLWLFIVPAITMRLVAEEKQNSTIELLFVQPIREWHVLLGKFFGAVAFMFIGLLLTLFVPFFLSFYGNFDWGTITAQYIGSLLAICVTVAIGLFASSLTKNQVVSFIIGVGILFGFVFIGFDVVLTSLSGVVKTVFEQLSLSWHFSNTIRGVLDLRDIIYFITATASFLLLAYWLMVRTQVNPKRKAWRQLKIGIGALVAIAVIINLLGLNIHGRLDLTKQNLYTLSDASKNIIRSSSDIVTIDMYSSEELPPEISIRQRDVSDMLTDYEVEANGNIRVVYHGVDSTNATEAETAGIQPVQFNVVKADEFQVKQGYFGLTISYLDDKEIISFIDRSDNFEYRLTSLIRKLTVDSTAKVGFLSGHGEKSIYADYATLGQELTKQYEIIDVAFNDETKDYGDMPEILVVAGPTKEVSEDEINKLREYVQNGGKVMFLLDGISLGAQSLTATANDNAINNLVSEFGVTINNDIVGDVRSHESVTFQSSGFNYVLPYPFWPRAQSSTESPITSGLSSVVMMWPSSLSVANDTSAVNLFTTTDSAFTQQDNFSLEPNNEIEINNEELTKKVLAVSIAADNDSQSTEGGRIIVAADSDFLIDGFAASSSQSLIFALNAIDWLAQDEGLAQVRAKQRMAEALVFESDSQKNIVKYVNLIGVPLAVVAFAFLHLSKRRKISKRQYSNKTNEE